MFLFKLHSRIFLSIAILMAGGLIAYAVFAEDQGSFTAQPSDEAIAAQGISFPVPELGNCATKEACKTYCEASEHISACVAFARTHGLMNKEEADRAESFAGALKAGGGPGGCKSPHECEVFCRNIDNMQACITFAETHNIKDKHVDQGKKILNYIRSGGKMPGGCNSKETCEAYCGDFGHAEECFAFAKRAGVFQEGKGFEADEGEHLEGDIPSEEQFQKFLDLAKRGETPGGCKSKSECEAYCHVDGHFEECVAFGEKMGFIRPEEAQMIRKSGGNGPGGCNSSESCRNYCNDPVHQEECFKFAEEHGFIKKEELQRTKEGFVRLRQGLENAPPEVAECLKSVVGTNVLNDIQSGKLVPGPEIGERVRSCFMKHGVQGNSEKSFQNVPQEVKTCLEGKLGDSFKKVISGEAFPTPEMGDVFRVCFQEFHILQGGKSFEDQGGVRGSEGASGQFGGPRPEMFQNFLKSAPSGVSSCLKEKLGDDFEKIQSGEIVGNVDTSLLKSCFENFHPMMMQREPKGIPFHESGSIPPEGMMPPVLPKPGVPGFQNLPPQILDCVKSTVGIEGLEKIMQGGTAEIGANEALKNCFSGVRPAEKPTILPPYPLPHPNPDVYREQYQKQYEEQYRERYEEQRLPQTYPNQPQQIELKSPTTEESPTPLPPTGGSILGAFQIFLAPLLGR